MSDERALKLGNEETCSAKRIKPAPIEIDRLSALPDPLIIHMLSLLGPDVKKTAVTCVLSKRWQFIWSELPRLSFCDRSLEIGKKCDFVSWVHRTLLFRSGRTHLDFLRIDFFYDECFAPDVNALVRFAVRSKTNELCLIFFYSKKYYTLPQVLYTDSSLRFLHVRECIVAPQGTVEWRSMTELFLECAELDERVIEKILSGCPVMRKLSFMSCRGFKRLDINSECLCELKVEDHVDQNEDPFLLEISAPYVRTLCVGISPVQFTNMPSLVSVKVHFNQFDDDSVEVMNVTTELLEKTLHVEELFLGGDCVKAVSELVKHGWRFGQSSRRSLRLDALRDESCIPTILGLLESSPNLDTLLIECSWSCDCYEEDVRTWGPTARDDLDCDLLKLKTVRLLDYADPNLGGEPMLTMARILLKRAPALELMVIDAKENLTGFSSEFASMSQSVLSYPKSSQKAVIHLRC